VKKVVTSKRFKISLNDLNRDSIANFSYLLLEITLRGLKTLNILRDLKKLSFTAEPALIVKIDASTIMKSRIFQPLSI